MSIRTKISQFIAAWRRGDRRRSPNAVRGRVYQRKSSVKDPRPSDGPKVTSRGEATLEIKVIRANGDVEVFRAPAHIREVQ